MSIKQKVKLAEAAQEVHIHVPPADPVETLIRDSERNNNAVRNLVDERDELRKENEALRNRVEFLVNANKHIADEREECRRQSDAAFYKAGQLAATLDGMKAFIERMTSTINECRDISDAHQQDAAPQPRHVYDQQGIPLDVLPPAPTLEECESLFNRPRKGRLTGEGRRNRLGSAAPSSSEEGSMGINFWLSSFWLVLIIVALLTIRP